MYFNTRIYNLNSVPQITRFLLEVAIVSNPCCGSYKQKRSNDIVKNKTMSTILSFIWILLIKQQSNILPCFYSLKVESSLFSNKIFT